jgi:cysteine dioxygenase
MAPVMVQESFGYIEAQGAFHKLVSELSKILGPSSGQDSSEIDVGTLQNLMENYSSSESEWFQYAFQDLSRGYTRNLVDEGNGKSNLVSIQ